MLKKWRGPDSFLRLSGDGTDNSERLLIASRFSARSQRSPVLPEMGDLAEQIIDPIGADVTDLTRDGGFASPFHSLILSSMFPPWTVFLFFLSFYLLIYFYSYYTHNI